MTIITNHDCGKTDVMWVFRQVIPKTFTLGQIFLSGWRCSGGAFECIGCQSRSNIIKNKWACLDIINLFSTSALREYEVYNADFEMLDVTFAQTH